MYWVDRSMKNKYFSKYIFQSTIPIKICKYITYIIYDKFLIIAISKNYKKFFIWYTSSNLYDRIFLSNELDLDI